MPRTRLAHRSLIRFNIVLANEDTAQAEVLHSLPDADQATIALYEARNRLMQDRVRGELLLVRHGDETRTVLRERLGTGAPLSPA